MTKNDDLVKITKVNLLREVNNDMCHNWYYLCYGKIYTKDRKQYQRFKYIVWFDVFDVCEYYDKDSVSKNEIKDYANELAVNFIPNWNMDALNCRGFLSDCNDTINRYNGIYSNNYWD